MTWQRNQEPNPRKRSDNKKLKSHSAVRRPGIRIETEIAFAFLYRILCVLFFFFWDFVDFEPSGTYPPRLTRLTLVCKVNRYRLVQVRQSLKRTCRVGRTVRNRLCLSPSDSLSFSSSSYMLPFFLKSILCDVKMRSVAVSHRVTTCKCGYNMYTATTLGDCSFPWKLEVSELAQKTLLLVKNGHLLRKATAILFSLRASWIECENKILFIPKWQRISFLWQILRPGHRTMMTCPWTVISMNKKIIIIMKYFHFSVFQDMCCMILCSNGVLDASCNKHTFLRFSFTFLVFHNTRVWQFFGFACFFL